MNRIVALKWAHLSTKDGPIDVYEKNRKDRHCVIGMISLKKGSFKWNNDDFSYYWSKKPFERVAA